MKFLKKIQNKFFMWEFNKLQELLYTKDDEYRKDFIKTKLPKQIDKLESLIKSAEKIYNEKDKIGGYEVIGLYDDIDVKFYTPENELQDIRTVKELYTVNKKTRQELNYQNMVASEKIDEIKQKIDDTIDEINKIIIYYDMYISLNVLYFNPKCKDKWYVYMLKK